MIVRTLSMAALLLLAPLAAAEAAPRPAPDAAVLSATVPTEYTAYRGHRRHRWAHRHHRRHHAYRAHRPWWLVTHPTWPACYDRFPFYCPTPERSRYVVRHRHHPRAVLSVRG